jgi:small redox-active disulfide protein 2
MKKIEVLGTGCPKCRKLFEMARQTVEELGLDAEVVKIEDIAQIMARGIMMTPGLVVDGAVKSVGKVPSPADLKNMLL